MLCGEKNLYIADKCPEFRQGFRNISLHFLFFVISYCQNCTTFVFCFEANATPQVFFWMMGHKASVIGKGKLGVPWPMAGAKLLHSIS